MSRLAAEVLAELLGVGPQGWAWNTDPTGKWAAALSPLADGIAVAEASAEAMLPEAVPAGAVELLEDFERVLGPDPCGTAPVTLLGRQQLATRRWTARGGQSIAYFVALAATQGIAATITEHPLDNCGRPITRCGIARCADEGAQFVWTVNLPIAQRVLAVCGGARVGAVTCNQSEPNGLECPIGREAPAHTEPVFNYV